MEKKQLIDKFQEVCSSLMKIPGIFNVSVVQSDGYPLAVSGLWLSKDEIFDLGAMVSAINAAAREISPSIEYILLEGVESKVAIFNVLQEKITLAATTSFDVNLGAILIMIKKIKNALIPLKDELDEYISMPLIEFSEGEKQDILSRKKVHNLMKRSIDKSIASANNTLFVTSSVYSQLNEVISSFRNNLAGDVKIYLVTNAGQLLYPLAIDDLFLAPFSHSIFNMSKKLLKFFRQDSIRQLMLSYSTNKYLIFDLVNGVLVINVSNSSNISTGLIRFLGVALSEKITKIFVRSKTEAKIPIEINVNDFF
ncbi:MAG: hypothetical protein ACP6IS_04795 [Candidatus Asgardarchaeia archaeon]